MRRIKFLLCILLALCVLLPGLPAALAEEADADDERFAGKTWDEVVAAFLQSWGTDPKTITLGYYNTVTGEEYYLNPDQYMVSGSMYKVPLNMVYAAKVADGEMDWDTSIGVFSYETLLEGSIVHSNNDYAKTLWYHLGNGSYRSYRRIIAPLMGEDPDEVDAKFYENNFFTARQMIFCLRELYENQDHYPRVIETMQRAEPNEYFKRRESRFNIAHKYGFLQTDYHLYMNDCGVAFTDDPILIVMFTDNVPHAYDVMTEFCTLMCDYAQYHHALRLEEEAAEAERRRQAAEVAAERQRQEELARQELSTGEEPAREPDEGESAGQIALVTPTESPEAPAEQAQPPVQRLVRRAEQEGLSQTALIAGAAVLLGCLIALIVLAALGKKYRVHAHWAVAAALLLCLVTLGRICWPAYRQLRSRPTGDAQETVQEFFDALSQGDYVRAYACLDGVETLGLEYEPEQESDRAVYAAMRGQFSAELYGECAVNGERAYQQVTCRYFDVDKLETEARTQAMILISRYVSTHPVGDLYNENGNYRPELMREAWDQAVAELLQNPENYRSSGGVQLELRWHDGAWRIMPNEKLLQLLCGGVKLAEKEGQA